MEGSLQSFKSFITEERQPYKVVILTVEHGDKSITAKKFEKQAKKMGFQTFLSNFKGVFISFENKGFGSSKTSDKTKVEENIITMKVKNFTFLLLESKQRIQAKSFRIHQPFFLLLNCEKLDLISYY